MMVFGALAILTVVTVAVRYLDLPVGPAIALALLIASVKASLVALFFMHLKGEVRTVVWTLLLTAMFFIVLMTIPLSWYLDGPMHREGKGPTARSVDHPRNHRALTRTRLRCRSPRSTCCSSRSRRCSPSASASGACARSRRSAACRGLVYGVLSLLAVPLLLVYGVRVRRKLKALGAFSS